MSDPSTILYSISNNRPARVFLPLVDREARFRVNGLYLKEQPPRFSLLFKLGVLPPAVHIDMAGTAIVTIDMGGSSVSFESRLLEMTDDRLLMAAAKSFSYKQMREFFRVDAVTSVISSSFEPEVLSEDSPARWQISGRTVDISGSGILATFGQKPPDEPRARLEMVLPANNREKIMVLAHPVRVVQAQPSLYEIAYHFDEINQEDRDKIVGCCLIIQRQMLRLQAEARNTITP
jgi:c-di-GMP-binding flagellar brake protein YcgR